MLLKTFAVRWSIATLLCLFWQIVPSQAALSKRNPLSADFARIVDEQMTTMMRIQQVRGAAIIVVQNGEVRYKRGYGYSDRARRHLYDPDVTISNLFSLSKPISTLAILKVAARLGIDLDADVNLYLRSIKLEKRSGGPVTLRKLLSHSAGLADDFRNEVALNPADVRKLEAHLADQPPRRRLPAGSLLAYSNQSINVAALVIQDVAGVPFADLLQKELLNPAGAFSITDRWPQLALKDGLVAQLHEGPPGAREVPFFLSNPFPAAGLVGTATDAGKIMQLFLEDGQMDGKQVVPKSVIRLMLTPEMFAAKGFPAYGLGIRIHMMGGHRFIEHAGENRNAFMMLPDLRFGVYLATSRHLDADALYPTFRKIASNLYDMPLDGAPELRPADKNMHPYAGFYADARRADAPVWRLGRSFAAPETAADRPHRELAFDAGGVLLLDGKQFSQIGQGIFRALETRSSRTGELSLLKLDTLATQQKVLTHDMSGFVRLGWYEKPSVVRSIFIGLAFALVAGLALVVIRHRNIITVAAAGLITALALAFPAIVTFYFRYGDRYIVERAPEPTLLTIAPYFPAISAVLALVFAAYARTYQQTTAVVLAGLVLVQSAVIWFYAFS
jgi:CubicO group peptidase (beta-lactamase class C family)